jgi:hypothetical protein
MARMLKRPRGAGEAFSYQAIAVRRTARVFVKMFMALSRGLG